MTELTHDELTKIAARWLEYKCRVVLVEAQGLIERADAIGFNATQSILVEAKASKSDFKRDKEKWVRSKGEEAYGFGSYRYYICEPGTITIKDLPDKWGLLYYYSGTTTMVKDAEKFTYNKEMLWRERNLLVTELGKSKKKKGW